MPRGKVKSNSVRPRIDVNAAIKARANDLKKQMKVSTEAEALAYLFAFYDEMHDRITLRQQKEFLKKAAETVKQQTFEG